MLFELPALDTGGRQLNKPPAGTMVAPAGAASRLNVSVRVLSLSVERTRHLPL
jgi:hypothetical protein